MRDIEWFVKKLSRRRATRLWVLVSADFISKRFCDEWGVMMLFMIIERFRDNDMVPIYQRLRDSGRSLPDGLEYVDSWIEPNFARCFQLMRCGDPRLFQEWVLQWRCFGVTFEIVPVVPSKETQAVVAPYLDPSGT
jgi:hypothetical protein